MAPEMSVELHLYRVLLSGDRDYAQTVDIMAADTLDAARRASDKYRNHTSAKCLGLTAELEARRGPTF